MKNLKSTQFYFHIGNVQKVLINTSTLLSLTLSFFFFILITFGLQISTDSKVWQKLLQKIRKPKINKSTNTTKDWICFAFEIFQTFTNATFFLPYLSKASRDMQCTAIHILGIAVQVISLLQIIKRKL